MRQIVIDGRLAKDAVISVSQNGRQHIKFSIANTIFKGNEEKTEWFDITSFDDFVINKKSKALTKGSYVIVTGNWETEANVSPKDGKLYINQRVVATDVNIPKVGKSSDATTTTSAPSVQVPSVPTPQVAQPTINIPSVEARLNAAPAPEFVMDKDADDDLPF